MRNVGYGEGLLTADGCVREVGELPATTNDCCPVDICNITSGQTMCSFVELLPNGPMWDRAKAERMAKYYAGPCEPEPWCFTGTCASVVDYAVYSGMRLYYLLRGPLWSSLREASVYTAVETIDATLELYGWSNWWETLCRDPRLGASPFDCDVTSLDLGACDANLSPVYIPQVPADLDAAVKRAIAISLYRLQMQPIKNLCGINWVLEPLAAELRPRVPLDPCGSMTWEVCNTSDMIASAAGPACSNNDPYPIPASFEINSLVFDPATGTCRAIGKSKIRVWPAVMAAQAIALSMIPTRLGSASVVRCENVN